MTPGFKILFAVDIVHDYFSNGVCAHFRLVPSYDTAALMTNCGALYKTVGNKLIVLIKADENNKPVKPPASNDRFVFFMELLKPVFMNITAPDYGQQQGMERFYFSNLGQNKFSFSAGEEILYLSETLRLYDAAHTYEKGAVVLYNDTTFECVVNTAMNESPATATAKWVERKKHPAATVKFSSYDKDRVYAADEIVYEDDIIYKCLQDNTVNRRPAVSAAFWQPYTNNQFATNSDLLKIMPKQFSYSLPAAAMQVEIKALALNTVNNKFERVVFTDVQHFEEPVKEVKIDLSNVKDAKYKLLVGSKEEWIYISNMAAYNGYSGVIELFNHLPHGNSFSFYKANGSLKDEKTAGKNGWLNYTIRFTSRLAFLKYIVPQKGVELIDTYPPTGVFTANANPPSSFTSNQRLPLQERSNDFKLKLKKKITADQTFPAPNPDINAPGMMTKDDTDYYCNVYLNY